LQPRACALAAAPRRNVMTAHSLRCVTLTLALTGLLGTSAARADVVLDWNAIMQATVSAQNPFAQARLAAITQLAVFTAVNAVSGGYEPYLDGIHAPHGASAEAAVVAAAHRVLTHYLPASAAALDAARQQSLAAIPDGPGKQAGIDVGEAAAAAMIAARTDDGSAPPQFFMPASSDPGEWQLTPSCPPAGGILYHWGNVAPFGVVDSTQFRAEPPPLLTSGRYRRDYVEVMEVGDAASTLRPADRSDVARFYNAVLAVGVWNDVARQIAGARPTTLVANARMLALLNIAISDGLVTVMETKYHYRFWRPETAIHQGANDGNRKTDGNPAFTPFILTPCFPSYPSAHASASYAGRAVLARIFGDHHHAIALESPAVPGVRLEYESLDEITDDIDDARVYGGIHFRFDQRAGGRQGSAIGDYIHRTHLRAKKAGR
jgi:hypothetical protein